MKKVFLLSIVMLIILLLTISVYAGSIPEDLLHSDDAQIFFAEVLYYHPNKEKPDIELSPVKVIKGDVRTGVKLTYYNPNTVGDFKVKEGNVYLFTYFDENNPTDVFEVTSYDTATLKIKNATGDMWKRFEKYLNEGRYLDAEHARIDKLNAQLTKTGKTITLTEYLGMDNISLGSISVYFGPDAIDVDRKAFREISNNIILEEINPTDIKVESGRGFHISAPENMEFVYISSDGKVSKNNLDGDLLKSVEYVIDSSEIAKLRQFFEEDDRLPFLETPLAGEVFRWSIMIIGIFAIAFVIGFIAKKKIN